MHKKQFKTKRRWFNPILPLVIFLFVFSPINLIHAKQHDNSDSDLYLDYIEEIISWKKANTGIDIEKPLINNVFLENAGDTAGDWYPIGMGRIGYDDDYDSYLAVIEDVVEKRYKQEDKLSDSKAT